MEIKGQYEFKSTNGFPVTSTLEENMENRK